MRRPRACDLSDYASGREGHAAAVVRVAIQCPQTMTAVHLCRACAARLEAIVRDAELERARRLYEWRAA